MLRQPTLFERQVLEGWAEAEGDVSGVSIAARLVEKIRFVRSDDVGSDLKLLLMCTSCYRTTFI